MNYEKSTSIVSRGKKHRKPTFIVLHCTGNPNVGAVTKYYTSGDAYPHYLIGHDGKVFSFCREDMRAAHAAWPSWEYQTYRKKSWKLHWQNPRTGKRKVMDDGLIYANWVLRWGDRFENPIELVKASGGENPNLSSIGIELLAPKHRGTGFSADQYSSLINLLIDISGRWNIPLPTKDGPSEYLCGHDDVSPIRRYAIGKGVAAGNGYDPGPLFAWSLLTTAAVG